MKTFTVAGFSTLKGVKKMRFANDLVDRVKVLQRNGHTDIELQELPQAMTKDEIRVFFGVAAEAAAPAETTTEAVDTTEVETGTAVEETTAAAEDQPTVPVEEIIEAAAAVPKKSKKGKKKDVVAEVLDTAETAPV